MPTAAVDAAAADSVGDERQQRSNNDDGGDAGHKTDDDGSNRHAKKGIAGADGSDEVDMKEQRRQTAEAWL